jgi:hypothetical protein
MSRRVFWVLFLTALAVTVSLKAVQLGWFAPRPPLALKGEPALLFFNKARGCECELRVYNNADAQMDAWNTPVRVIRIDMEQRSDLARQYDVIRAPTLVLLNAKSEIVWRQDETMNDVAPLDLEQIETLLAKD